MLNIKDFGAIPNDGSPSTAMKNAIAIQETFDTAKMQRDSRLAAAGYAYQGQKFEVFIPGEDFYIDRTVYHPGFFRVTGPSGTKGRLFGTRQMPIMVLGGPSGNFQTSKEYRESTSSKVINGGYDLSNDRIFLGETGFDNLLHPGSCYGLGLIFTMKETYVNNAITFYSFIPGVELSHSDNRLYFSIRTSDDRYRAFSAPLILQAGQRYELYVEYDGTIAILVNGKYIYVEKYRGGKPLQNVIFARVENSMAFAGSGEFILQGLKISTKARLNHDSKPGTELNLTANQLATGFTDPGDLSIVNMPANNSVPGSVLTSTARVKDYQSVFPGLAMWWPNKYGPSTSYCEVENIALVSAVQHDTENLYGCGIMGLDTTHTLVKNCDFRGTGFGYVAHSVNGVHTYFQRIQNCNFDRNARAAICIDRSTSWINNCIIQYAGDYSLLIGDSAVISNIGTLDSGRKAAIRVRLYGDGQCVSIKDCNFGDEAMSSETVFRISRHAPPYNPTARANVIIEGNSWSGHRSGKNVIIADGPSYVGDSMPRGLLKYTSQGNIGSISIEGHSWDLDIGNESSLIEVNNSIPNYQTSILGVQKPFYNQTIEINNLINDPKFVAYYRAEDQDDTINVLKDSAGKYDLELVGDKPCTIEKNEIGNPIIKFNGSWYKNNKEVPPLVDGMTIIFTAGEKAVRGMFTSSKARGGAETLYLNGSVNFGGLWGNTTQQAGDSSKTQVFAFKAIGENATLETWINGAIVDVVDQSNSVIPYLNDFTIGRSANNDPAIGVFTDCIIYGGVMENDRLVRIMLELKGKLAIPSTSVPVEPEPIPDPVIVVPVEPEPTIPKPDPVPIPVEVNPVPTEPDTTVIKVPPGQVKKLKTQLESILGEVNQVLDDNVVDGV